MAKDVILAADLGGDLLTADELAAIPDFSGIRKEIWDKFPGAIARKLYRAGEILMREGEYGTTAFYILSGTIELYINNPVSHVESSRAKGAADGEVSQRSRTTSKACRHPEPPACLPMAAPTYQSMPRWTSRWMHPSPR